MNENISKRCDICGKFIPYKDFEDHLAIIRMITPDSDYSIEVFETLCKKCNKNKINL